MILIEHACWHQDQRSLELGCMLFPSQPWVYGLKMSPSGLLLDFALAPPCVAPINANIVERRSMLWEGMGLAVDGVRDDITDMLL